MTIPIRVVPLFLILACFPASADYQSNFRQAKLAIDARTVYVAVDPQTANRTGSEYARIDVETALAKWGRYSIAAANEVGRVDLVVTVCVNLNRPIAPVPQTRINVPLGSKGGDGADEFCEANDTLKVYAGDVAIGGPSGTPLWIYSAKDSLRHPDVPAVVVLRRAIEHAEREEQTRQQKKQQKRQKQNPQQGNPQNQP